MYDITNILSEKLNEFTKETQDIIDTLQQSQSIITYDKNSTNDTTNAILSMIKTSALYGNRKSMSDLCEKIQKLIKKVDTCSVTDHNVELSKEKHLTPIDFDSIEYTRLKSTLARNGIYYWEMFSAYTEKEVKRMKNVGGKTFGTIIDLLSHYNIQFAHTSLKYTTVHVTCHKIIQEFAEKLFDKYTPLFRPKDTTIEFLTVKATEQLKSEISERDIFSYGITRTRCMY